MAYIGKSIESGTFKVLDTSGNTYNGSNATFDLGTQVGSAAQLLVSHDGVIQKPGTDYSLASNGTQITFSTEPASGASIFIVEISGAVGGTVTPTDASVTADKLNTALLTGQTDIGGAIADADLFLVDDGAGGTLRKTAASRLKTYVGGFDVSSITGATALGAEPATTDEFVLSDAGTLKRVDYSHIRGSEVLLATATRTSGSASQVNLDDFMDNNKYLFYRAIVVAKNAGNGNSQFFNFTAAGGGTMEESSWHAAVNQVKNSGGTVSNNTGDGADGSNKMTWVTNESTRAFSVEFIMTPYGLVTDMGLSSVHFIGQSDRCTGSAREVQCVTGAGYYLESTVPKGFVIGAVGGNWERYEIRVYGHKKV